MLTFLTFVVIGIVVYAFTQEDLPTALMTCVNVFFAGLIAFNYWEPIAVYFEEQLANSPFSGYEDAIALLLLFCPILALLRLTVNNLSPALIEFSFWFQRAGSAVFGFFTGYLVAGFMLCVMQTMPLHVNFMSFQPTPTPGLRRWIPPDRVWLALMHRAGDQALYAGEDPGTFDRYGSFEIRYARYRRYADRREALPYRGECDPSRPPAPTEER